MRVGPRIKELCAALEGMGSAAAAEIPRAVRRELEPVWAADTRRKLLALGLWPKALPLQNLSTGEDFERTLKNRT